MQRRQHRLRPQRPDADQHRRSAGQQQPAERAVQDLRRDPQRVDGHGAGGRPGQLPDHRLPADGGLVRSRPGQLLQDRGRSRRRRRRARHAVLQREGRVRDGGNGAACRRSRRRPRSTSSSRATATCPTRCPYGDQYGVHSFPLDELTAYYSINGGAPVQIGTTYKSPADVTGLVQPAVQGRHPGLQLGDHDADLGDLQPSSPSRLPSARRPYGRGRPPRTGGRPVVWRCSRLPLCDAGRRPDCDIATFLTLRRPGT